MKKTKFVNNISLDYNKQPYYEISKNDNAHINIKKNTFNNRDKTQVELKDKFDPYNYNLNYVNTIKKDEDENLVTYFPAFNQGPGRGFGNPNVNNNIRLGDSGREDNNEFKSFKESEIVDRFDFIDNRFNNPKNVVFPFPRSGEMTRKVHVFDDSTINNINEYNWTTPNLEKKEVYQPFEKAFAFNYTDVTTLPNQSIVNKINDSNDEEKIRQLNRMKERQSQEQFYSSDAAKYKNEFTDKLLAQTSQNYSNIKSDYLLHINKRNIPKNSNIPEDLNIESSSISEDLNVIEESNISEDLIEDSFVPNNSSMAEYSSITDNSTMAEYSSIPYKSSSNYLNSSNKSSNQSVNSYNTFIQSSNNSSRQYPNNYSNNNSNQYSNNLSQYSNNNSNQYSNNNSNQYSKNSSRQSSNNSSGQSSNNSSGQSSNNSSGQYSNYSNNNPQQSSNNSSGQSSNNSSKNNPQQSSNNSSGQYSNNSSKNNSQQSSNNNSGQYSNYSNNNSQQSSNNSSGQYSNYSNNNSQQSSNNSSGQSLFTY